MTAAQVARIERLRNVYSLVDLVPYPSTGGHVKVECYEESLDLEHVGSVLIETNGHPQWVVFRSGVFRSEHEKLLEAARNVAEADGWSLHGAVDELREMLDEYR